MNASGHASGASGRFLSARNPLLVESFERLLRTRKRLTCGGIRFLCACIMLCAVLALMPAGTMAAPTSKRVRMRVGQSVRLQMKDVGGSVIWRVTAGSKCVAMNQNGILKAKKKGSAVVEAVCNSVPYRFRIQIRKAKRRQSRAVREITLSAAGSFPAPGKAENPAIPRLKLATTTGAKVEEKNMILIGDSRFQGMHAVVGGKAAWFHEAGEGVYWLRDKVIPKLALLDVKNKAVVINLGVNDYIVPSTYLSVLKSLGKNLQKRKAAVYFMTVNPADEKEAASQGISIANKSLAAFNKKIAKSLTGFGIINTYDYLADHGFSTVDGVHYTSSTYRTIYKVMCDAIRK